MCVQASPLKSILLGERIFFYKQRLVKVYTAPEEAKFLEKEMYVFTKRKNKSDSIGFSEKANKGNAHYCKSIFRLGLAKWRGLGSKGSQCA